MNARILALRSLTEAKVPRWMALTFDDAEPDLHEVEPGAGGRREMHLDPQVGGEPVADLDPHVGGVVVHDQVKFDRPALWIGARRSHVVPYAGVCSTPWVLARQVSADHTGAT
jgi:hypothetical protein